MADALCGPSNALQSFQKHSQQDRTLQQDRLISRAGPSQAFRSPAQNAGALDPEFEAFQAGVPAPPFAAPASAPAPFFQQAIVARHHAPVGKAPVVNPAPDWALDFQRLNLSSPAPPVQQNAGPAPTVFSSAAVAPSSLISAGPSFANAMYEPSYSDYMIGPVYGQSRTMGYVPGHEEQIGRMFESEAQQMPVFDDAAFAAAFDSAAAIIQAELPVEAQQKKHVTFNEIDALMKSDEELDTIMEEAFTRTGNKDDDFATLEINKARLHESTINPEPIIEQQSKPNQERGADDGDALAYTARQLLDSVSHETSEKFAQSSFLALMRKLRDREVKVDGENFIESSTNTIANTTGEASSTLDLGPESDSPLDIGAAGPVDSSESIDV